MFSLSLYIKRYTRSIISLQKLWNLAILNYVRGQLWIFKNSKILQSYFRWTYISKDERGQLWVFKNSKILQSRFRWAYISNDVHGQLWVFEICFRYQTMYFLIDQTIKSHLLKCAPSFYFHVVADSSDDVREKLVFILHICRKRTMSSRPSLHIKREGSQVEQLLKQRPRC